MNTVDAIKNKRDINKIKRCLHGRNRLLFTLGVSLGLRISDLLKLKVGDLRGKTFLKIKEGKTGKYRRIDFSNSVLRDTSKLTGDDDDYVFESRKRNADGSGRPISRTQAYRILNAAAERARVDLAIGTHSLRKTHGWLLYNNGVPLSRIMVMLNHSSEAVTARYIGITQDEITAAYRSLEV